MKPTLGQVFALSLCALAAVLALLFYVVFSATRATIIESSGRVRSEAGDKIGDRVASFLSRAPEAVRQVQLALNRGLFDPRDPLAMESALFSPLLASSDIGEVTLTYGDKIGDDTDGNIQLEAARRGQLSVVRTRGADGNDLFWSRHVHMDGSSFVADRRQLKPAARFADLPLIRESFAEIPDPTTHPTFTTPARSDFYGRLLWSDLHWSQLDADLPEPQRRVEVSVQQAVSDSDGKFVGVLRVGLLAQQLDRAVQVNLAARAAADPHRIFICDPHGLLITRGMSTDSLHETDDGLRVVPELISEPIASALADPKLREIGEKASNVSGQFRQAGEDFLTTFRALPGTQDWIVGIVVPRSFYLGKLTTMRDRLLIVSLGIIVLLISGGGLILRGVKRAQAQIEKESLKMNAFEFSPASTASAFRDVSEVLESLEKAKTAMRAMGKYVPVDLVRRLYREKSEPILGAEEIEVSIMFTDIKDFTTISERLAPGELAAALGRYLEVMARIIQQETRGTIDKYIGDAIMTFWNAPEPVADHARLACLAALRCCEAGRALAQAPEWRGRPSFETRFGLHRDAALIGHFGAPDRMNYTAIGDAVNLASRLEGLNKHYGTTIIASESIVAQVREHFIFRRLDRVAVKGKAQAVQIYELLGTKDGVGEVENVATAYERAFDAYLARDFATAAGILEKQTTDVPSAVLLKRCLAFQAEPPPVDWQGVSVATSK